MNNFYLENINPNSKIHFVGIGGISMSGLARIVMQKGFRVSGSDISESKTVVALRETGAEIFIGHKAENVFGADLLVYTAAVKQDNPELVYARENNISSIERSMLLGAIMRGFKNSIGIAGTHGKTTTTSMLSHVLLACELDPTITIGGELDAIGGNIRVGKSDYFLTEACEYHCSFLEFFPSIAVVTNVDADHLDYFRNLDHIKQVFTDYLAIPDEDGFAVVCGDDKDAMECIGMVRGEILTYGLSDENTFCAQNLKFNEKGQGIFDVEYDGEIISVKLNVSGKHNVLNALACFAVGYALGLDGKNVKEGVEAFSLVHRRFERKGFVNEALVIDDYAHHPTEIRCTLETAKNITKGKLYVVFQPHTYTRTKALFDEFEKAFDMADEILFTNIYAAREKDTGLVNSAQLAEAVKKRGKICLFVQSFDEAEEYIRKSICKDDSVICMGAGDIFKLSESLIK